MKLRTIIISPYSRKLRNNARNPKNYPYWSELVQKLVEREYNVMQIGVKDEVQINKVEEFKTNLKLKEIKELLEQCHIWISVDNFLQHLASHTTKPGIVLFGKSDPLIFGYPQNINLLKNRKHLRAKQFDIWEAEAYDSSVFVKPEIVVSNIPQ